jgi:hypothetical protein
MNIYKAYIALYNPRLTFITMIRAQVLLTIHPLFNVFQFYVTVYVFKAIIL